MGDASLPPRPAAPAVQPRATTLFLGSIAKGISDAWIRSLFESCGQVRTVTRPNPTFAFVEYVEPASVAQALRALAGRELPAVPPGSGPSKALNVKADAKTTAYMDEWRAGAAGAAAEADDGAHAGALDRVNSLIEMLRRGEAPPPSAFATESTEAPTTEEAANVQPQHLQDLDKTVIPDEMRGSILGEIAAFRSTAAVKAQEQRRHDAARAAALEHERMMREQRDQSRPNVSSPAWKDARSSRSPFPGRGLEISSSPARPAVDSGIDPEERDEFDEELRKQQEEVAKKSAAASAERRCLEQEDRRLARWNQVEADEDRKAKRQADDAARLERRMASYDPSTELFHTDRSRWRYGRAQLRAKEKHEDERLLREGALAHEAEQARLGRSAEQQRAAGVLLPQTSTQPIRLTLARAESGHPPAQSSASPAPAPTPAPQAATQTAPPAAPTAEPMNTAPDPAMLEQQRTALPSSLEEIAQYTPNWNRVDQNQAAYRSLIDQRVTEAMDEPVPELVDALMEKVAAHASAQDLVAEVEPALDEDAVPLVAALWRKLVADSL